MPGEGRADAALTGERLLHFCVEARQHAIVTVQQMNEMSVAALETGVEVAWNANIRRLSMKSHAPAAACLHHGLRIVAGVIVDDLDLHDLGAGILGKHTLQRFREVSRAVVS